MRNSRMLSGLVAAVALVALVGCSSDTSTPSSDTPAASAAASKPEDQRTSAAAVAIGMKAINALRREIAAAPAAQGKTLSEGIEPLWQPIEGTVQENSQEHLRRVRGRIHAAGVRRCDEGPAGRESCGHRDHGLPRSSSPDNPRKDRVLPALVAFIGRGVAVAQAAATPRPLAASGTRRSSARSSRSSNGTEYRGSLEPRVESPCPGGEP